MKTVTMRSPHGKEWDLTGSPLSSAVMAPLGALQTLVGNVTRVDVPASGGVGVIPGVPRYGALEATIDFYLQSDDMESTYKDFRRAFSVWSPLNPPPVEIVIDPGHDSEVFTFDLWLSQPLPGTSVRMSAVDSVTITANVFSPLGLARSHVVTGTGVVTVTNSGDVIVYPSFSYSGAGGQVIAPSGATYILPPVTEHTFIKTDPMNLKVDGAFPEGVPAKDSATWTLPPGVTASWETWVADPWS